MLPSQIISHRLINQQIAEIKFKKPHEIVKWLVAMQAQEYAMSKWAVGLRLQGVNDSDVERAFNNGEILRTHLMRPTWHFVCPEDIRWLLVLTAPRVKAQLNSMNRKLELDSKVFNRSNDLLLKTMEDKKHLTRNELREIFERKKFKTDDFRMAHLLMNAELDGIICSGARRGKQHTYALLEERVRAAKKITYEESLRELAVRYFASRNPATVQDFVWWSGLTVKQAREAVQMLPKNFTHQMIEGKEYFFSEENLMLNKNSQTTFLMPDYDEYGISYKDRSAIFSSVNMSSVSRGNPVFNRMIIIDGKIEGTWKRTEQGNSVLVETFPFEKLNRAKEKAVANSIKRFKEFANN